MSAKFHLKPSEAHTEYRLHPADWDALKIELEPLLLRPALLNTSPMVMGMFIIVDPSADRLRCKEGFVNPS